MMNISKKSKSKRTSNTRKKRIKMPYTRLIEKTNFPSEQEDYMISKDSEYNHPSRVDILIDEIIQSYSSCATVYKNNKLLLNIKNKKDSKFIEIFSMTKSFLGLAILFLLQDKKIASLNDPVSKYIKSWGYGKKKDIQIIHILTHKSGLDPFWDYDKFMWPNSNYDDYKRGILPTPNVFNISLVIDKTADIDGDFKYNDTASQVICTIVYNITEMDISKYLNIKLFRPLDIQYKWNHDDYGNSYGPNGLMMNTESLCKIGLLILNNGMWNKKRIIQNKFIDEFIKPRVMNDEIITDQAFSNSTETSYGLLCWRDNNKVLFKGRFGQYLVIDLEKKVVGSRLIETKWDNPLFEKATNEDLMYFNDFSTIISEL